MNNQSQYVKPEYVESTRDNNLITFIGVIFILCIFIFVVTCSTDKPFNGINTESTVNNGCLYYNNAQARQFHCNNVYKFVEFTNFISKYNSNPVNFTHRFCPTSDTHTLLLNNGYSLRCIVTYSIVNSVIIPKYQWLEIPV